MNSAPNGNDLMRILFGVVGEAVKHNSLSLSIRILPFGPHISDLNIWSGAEQWLGTLLQFVKLATLLDAESQYAASSRKTVG
jgi:hypothetical protein